MSKVKKRCFVVTGSLKNFHQFQPPHSAESIPLLQEVLGEGASLSLQNSSSLPCRPSHWTLAISGTPRVSVIFCTISYMFQFHLRYGHVSGWLWFYHLFILLPLGISRTGLSRLPNLHTVAVAWHEKFLSYYMSLIFPLHFGNQSIN